MHTRIKQSSKHSVGTCFKFATLHFPASKLFPAKSKCNCSGVYELKLCYLDITIEVPNYLKLGSTWVFHYGKT